MDPNSRMTRTTARPVPVRHTNHLSVPSLMVNGELGVGVGDVGGIRPRPLLQVALCVWDW